MLLLPDAVPCTCLEPRAHWFAHPHAPMFPCGMTASAAVYRCIRCGRKIILPFEDVTCAQSIFGVHVYNNGRCTWVCPIHGHFDLPLAQVIPAFQQERILQYLLPCCVSPLPAFKP